MKISIDKLYCIRKTLYSRIYIMKDNPGYYLKDNYHVERLIQEYKNLTFLKNNKFNNIPEFELKNIGHRYFLILKNIETELVWWDKINKEQVSQIINTIRKLHEIKSRKSKTLKYFFDQEIYRTRINLNDYNIINLHNKTKKFKYVYNLLLEYVNYIEKCSRKYLSEKEKCSFIHRDLGSYHIFYSNGEIKIIDWEDSSFGDPASDLSQLFYEPKFPKKMLLNQYSTLKEKNIIMKRIKFYRYLQLINQVLHLIGDSINLSYELDSWQNIKETFYEKKIILTLIDLKKIRKDLQNSL